jgi:transcriptional regulator with XRE-family HTH domain
LTRRPIAVTKEEIGQRLKAVRQRRGLTQAKLARLLGTLQSNVSDIERGARKPTLQQLVNLSRALKVPVDEILSPDKPVPGNGLPDSRFLRRLGKIEKLSKRDQQALLKNIDMFLKGAGIS